MGSAEGWRMLAEVGVPIRVDTTRISWAIVFSAETFAWAMNRVTGACSVEAKWKTRVYNRKAALLKAVDIKIGGFSA